MLDEYYVKISRTLTGDSIKIPERYVKLREGKNNIMAFSIKAPIFETEEIERFFEGYNSSEKLMVDIAGTGGFGANFRGIIDGKEKNFSKNLNHIILLLEEFHCPSREELKRVKRVSKFMPRNYFS